MKTSMLLKDRHVVIGFIVSIILDVAAIVIAFKEMSIFIWGPLLFLGYGLMKMTVSRIRMLTNDKNGK